MAFPSTFDDICDQVIARVRLDASSDLAKVKDWVNQTYANVCIETEAIQDFDTLTTTASVATYTLDTAIVRIKQMYITPSGQGQSRPLQPTSIEQILEWSANNGASSNVGAVTHYALFGIQNIQFYPTPSGTHTITLYYVKLPAALSADADVPVLQEPYVSKCLIEGACFQAAMFLKDPDAALYKQNYDMAVRELRGHMRRREGSMTRQFRVTRGNGVIPSDPSVDIRSL